MLRFVEWERLSWCCIPHQQLVETSTYKLRLFIQWFVCFIWLAWEYYHNYNYLLYVGEHSLSSTQLVLFYPHSAYIRARTHSPRFMFTFQAFRIWEIRFHTHKVINTRYIMFCNSKKCLFLNRHLHIQIQPANQRTSQTTQSIHFPLYHPHHYYYYYDERWWCWSTTATST